MIYQKTAIFRQKLDKARLKFEKSPLTSPLNYPCEQLHCIFGPYSINKKAESIIWKSSACTIFFDQNSQIPTFSIRRSPLSSLSCLKTAKETAKIGKKSNNSKLFDCLSVLNSWLLNLILMILFLFHFETLNANFLQKCVIFF